MSDERRGVIKWKGRAQQLRDYSGMQYDKITPTVEGRVETSAPRPPKPCRASRTREGQLNQFPNKEILWAQEAAAVTGV